MIKTKLNVYTSRAIRKVMSSKDFQNSTRINLDTVYKSLVPSTFQLLRLNDPFSINLIGRLQS